MFHNNTELIKKLAIRGIKKDKLRNILIVMVIIISSCLLTFAVLMQNTFAVENRNKLETMQEVIYSDITAESMASLQENPVVEEFLLQKTGKPCEFEDYTIKAAYVEEEKGRMKPFLPFEGTFPLKQNEILLDKSISTLYEKDLNIGDEIEIEWQNSKKEIFIVTALTSYDGASGNDYTVYVSEEYASNGSELKDVKYALAAKISESGSMSKEAFLDVIYKIGEDAGVARKDINPNNRYADSLEVDMMTVSTYITVSLFVFVVSAVVVYTVFYISVVGRTKDLAQLRAMGATRKQIKKIINFEGIFLAMYGVPIGIIIANIIIIIAKPSGVEAKSSVIISLACACVMVLTVLIAIRKPAKLAGKTSPINAGKFINEKFLKSKTKILKRRLTPFNIATMQRKTNTKKVILTSVSLGLTGVVFMLGATFLSSYNVEKNARQSELVYNDIVIGIKENATDSRENGLSEIQQEKPYSEKIIEQIKSIEGVKSVTPLSMTNVYFNFGDGFNAESDISAVNKDDIKAYQKYVEDLDVDYDKMIAENGVIFTEADYYSRRYGEDVKVGDKVTLSWFDGTKEREDEFTIMGMAEYIKTTKLFSDSREDNKIALQSRTFLVAEETLKGMMSEDFSPVSKLLIETENWEKYGEKVTKKVKEVIKSSPNIRVEQSLKDNMEMAESIYESMLVMIIAVLSFLGVFSVINIFNTLITNVLSRKKEFAVMQSVGLSSLQLKKIITYEGLLLGIYNAVITLTLGTLAGYLMVLLFEAQNINYLDYTFPLVWFVGYLIAVLVIPVVISAVAIKVLEKKSMVERLGED